MECLRSTHWTGAGERLAVFTCYDTGRFSIIIELIKPPIKQRPLQVVVLAQLNYLALINLGVWICS